MTQLGLLCFEQRMVLDCPLPWVRLGQGWVCVLEPVCCPGQEWERLGMLGRLLSMAVVVVGHNLSFDFRALAPLWSRARLPMPVCTVLDTLWLARLEGIAGPLDLASLCGSLGLPSLRAEHPRVVADVLMTHAAAQALTRRVGRREAMACARRVSWGTPF